MSPIIDLIVNVDKAFIEKFELKLDTTSHLKRDNKVFLEIFKRFPAIELGGCSYNALRVLNWMMKETKEFGKSAGIFNG